jgi:hypothetical protein
MTDQNRTALLLETLRPYSPQFHDLGQCVSLGIFYGSDGHGRSLVKTFTRSDETAAMEAAVEWLLISLGAD